MDNLELCLELFQTSMMIFLLFVILKKEFLGDWFIKKMANQIPKMTKQTVAGFEVPSKDDIQEMSREFGQVMANLITNMKKPDPADDRKSILDKED